MNRVEIEAVADQYRADGYDVIVQPTSAELPEFLQRHSIDLLASRNDESVVVAIKRQNGVQTDVDLTYLAADINARDGWRFDLFVSPNDNPWPDQVSQDSVEPGADRISELAETAERLLALEELEAACLVAWSALEASMRECARKASVDLEDNSPRYVINALATDGILSVDEYETLQDALRVRNAVAHGLTAPGLTPELVQSLLALACELLDRQFTASEAAV